MSEALLIAQMLLQHGPAAARALAEIFQKPNPTLQDWEVVFARAEKPYSQLVPNSRLTKEIIDAAALQSGDFKK